MLCRNGLPAEFANSRLRSRRLGFFTQGNIDGKFKVQFGGAAVAFDLPIENSQLAEYRALGYRDPLPGRADQAPDFLHLQTQAQVATAF